ncbi:MAG: hypothetical protein NVSMB42_14580 [Herpetosiphon sp.]
MVVTPSDELAAAMLRNSLLGRDDLPASFQLASSGVKPVVDGSTTLSNVESAIMAHHGSRYAFSFWRGDKSAEVTDLRVQFPSGADAMAARRTIYKEYAARANVQRLNIALGPLADIFYESQAEADVFTVLMARDQMLGLIELHTEKQADVNPTLAVDLADRVLQRVTSATAGQIPTPTLAPLAQTAVSIVEPGLSVMGLVSTPRTYSMEEVGQLPPVTATLPDPDGTPRDYLGVAVSTLLDNAGPLPYAQRVLLLSSTGQSQSITINELRAGNTAILLPMNDGSLSLVSGQETQLILPDIIQMIVQ